MKRIYKSAQWKAVNERSRASILLVNEGVKPISNFLVESKAQLAKIIEVLDKLELSYRVSEKRRTRKMYKNLLKDAKTPEQKKLYKQVLKNFPKDKKAWIRYTVEIAKNKETLEDFCKKRECAGNKEEKFRIDGKFYGYTPCSVKAFIDLDLTFYNELLKLLKEKKRYPEEFLYLMPNQVPCSINCKRCKKLAKLWKCVLERHDPQAAKSLKSFNRNTYNQTRIRKKISEIVWGRKLLEQRFTEKVRGK